MVLFWIASWFVLFSCEGPPIRKLLCCLSPATTRLVPCLGTFPNPPTSVSSAIAPDETIRCVPLRPSSRMYSFGVPFLFFFSPSMFSPPVSSFFTFFLSSFFISTPSAGHRLSLPYSALFCSLFFGWIRLFFSLPPQLFS